MTRPDNDPSIRSSFTRTGQGRTVPEGARQAGNVSSIRIDRTPTPVVPCCATYLRWATSAVSRKLFFSTSFSALSGCESSARRDQSLSPNGRRFGNTAWPIWTHVVARKGVRERNNRINLSAAAPTHPWLMGLRPALAVLVRAGLKSSALSQNYLPDFVAALAQPARLRHEIAGYLGSIARLAP